MVHASTRTHHHDNRISLPHTAGVDTYLACLSFYNNVQQTAKRNVPGSNTVLDNLKRFFPCGGSSTPPAPPPNP